MAWDRLTVRSCAMLCGLLTFACETLVGVPPYDAHGCERPQLRGRRHG